MTTALCIFCGEMKIGAFSVCDKCNHPPSGDEELDIFFTDWHYPEEALEQFGNLSKALKEQSKDPIPVFREIIARLYNDDSIKSDDETDTSF